MTESNFQASHLIFSCTSLDSLRVTYMMLSKKQVYKVFHIFLVYSLRYALFYR